MSWVMKINYISNIPENESSGGGSGVNKAVYKYFEKRNEYFNYQYINPNPNKIEQFKSKLQKLFHRARKYFFFSESRLKKIKRSFKHDPYTDIYFFHGFTPWIKIKPDKPYFCFNDACFATYVEIYNNSDHFSKKDVERIFVQEKNWLKNAAAVLFRSNWALEETKRKYHLEGYNFHNVGVGGFIDIPSNDTYSNGKDFLFIAREFIPKGGPEASMALQKVLDVYPDVSLQIVGEKPNEQILQLPGIKYIGFLNKNNPEEKKILQEIFSKSFALIHPTVKDTNTLVITELAYYGCPAISTNKFAIPEYLINNETGYLVEDPKSIEEIASKMIELIKDAENYSAMRLATRENALNNNTWEVVLQRIEKIINEKK